MVNGISSNINRNGVGPQEHIEKQKKRLKFTSNKGTINNTAERAVVIYPNLAVQPISCLVIYGKMKRYLIILPVVFFFGCSPDVKEPPPDKNSKRAALPADFISFFDRLFLLSD